MVLQLHILLVALHVNSDDQSIPQLLVHSGTTNYTLTRIKGLETGLTFLQASQVDLVLLDIGRVSGAIGLQAIDRVCTTMPGVPIIVLADQEDTETALKTVEVGAQDYLVKTHITADALDRVIRHGVERHRYQQRIKESEQFLRTTLDVLSANIAILDNSGRIIKVNKAWKEFARENDQASESVSEGAQYLDICLKATGTDVEIATMAAIGIKAVIEGERDAFQIEYPCHSPEQQRWFHLRVTPFPDVGRRRVVVAHENITSRKLAEMALSESERRLRLIFDTSPNCMFIKNGQGHFVMVNKATAQLYQRDEQEMLGQSDAALSKSGWQRVADTLPRENCPSGTVSQTIEETFVQDDGTTRLFCVFRVPMAYDDAKDYELTIAIDVSKLKEILGKLHHSELLMQTILDTVASRIIVMNRDLRVIWANLAACRHGNKERIDIIGRYCHEVFQQESAVCQDCPVEQAIVENKLSERSIKTSGGRTWLTYVNPIQNDAGEIVNLVEVADDITERLTLERQLQQAQKMESLGTLAGGIAHDFNNILSGILGYTELAKMKSVNNPALVGYLDEIYAAGIRATELVRQILTFSRRRNVELRPFRIQLVIKEALKLLRSTLPATVELHSQISKDIDPVLADPTQIHQIIMNLCTNAFHAMEPDGGTLTVRVEQITATAQFYTQHPDLTAESYILVQVSDTGCGMTADIMASIFDPYFTTKDLGEGTGLGLAVVHGIVKEYGGEILVHSIPEEGSTFTIYLPVTPEKELAPQPGAQRHDIDGSERILLVEDEPVLCKLCHRILEQQGYQVTSVNDPLKALELFGKDPEGFDLVLTDMTMPRMTGEKMGLHMMAIRPGLPVLLMTGFTQQLTDELVRQQGFQGLLAKPLIKNNLLNKLREIFSGTGTVDL